MEDTALVELVRIYPGVSTEGEPALCFEYNNGLVTLTLLEWELVISIDGEIKDDCM